MKSNTKILLGVLLIGIFVTAIVVPAISVNKNDVKVNTSIDEKDNSLKNNSVFNKWLIFKIGGDKVYVSYGFKGNISAGETIDYVINTTGWEEVNVRFYSDDGIDINIVEGHASGITDVVEKKFENVKKNDYKIKDGQKNISISIKGNKKGKYGIIITVVKKKYEIKGKKFNVSELKEAIKEIKPSTVENNLLLSSAFENLIPRDVAAGISEACKVSCTPLVWSIC
ncbi:MAG: hypothetical protein COZ66_00005 [Candidatus Huberarchaeum crystalense]|uniref:Uncharacterized protein n=1 Tax=Huberarchaeum crystalense TaxID=2014257 RepID=A0A2H9N4M7_HUBC1|nr:MAG: hypothetical protein COS45_01300 [Candidatus Huberarchaeum crystalense]PIX28321.1 MAG: hypothetical protein COZ66_00005 [Candidatus Huberarchaeum crystalense]